MAFDFLRGVISRRRCKMHRCRTDAANYRPVLLTSVPSKVMESIIKKKLVRFWKNNDISCKAQHGFTRGRSFLTNLLKTLENWTRALDKGYGLDAVYFNYKKAFNSVPHRRILEKLKGFGIKWKLLHWLEDFLTSRTMRVGISCILSLIQLMLSGVPQGTY